MNEFGELKSHHITSLWNHEAWDFTPWLKQPENLALLSNALGLELENPRREVPAGGFSTDIVADLALTNDTVVIENQLRKTDHDHLGKLITYAAHHKAKYLVWVVGDVREEHVSAVTWLNEHLDDETGCFLVKAEGWSVDDSRIALRFDVIVSKPIFQPTLDIGGSRRPSSLQPMLLTLWTTLTQEMTEIAPSLKTNKPQGKNWLNAKFVDGNCRLRLTASDMFGRLSADVYISDDFALRDYLHSKESDLSDCLGSEIDWFQASKASGLRVAHFVDDVFDSSKYSEYAKWFADTCTKLESCVGPLIAEYESQD